MRVTTAVAKPAKFKGFAGFCLGWCMGGLTGGASAPVAAAVGTDHYFTFVFQVLAGLAIGALMSVPYTLLQNIVNAERRWPLSWAMALSFGLVAWFALVLLVS
jgi:hypothetical protein